MSPARRSPKFSLSCVQGLKWRSLVCVGLVTALGLGPLLYAAETTKGSASKDKKEEPKTPPLGEITILVPDKTFRKEGPNKALRVGYDDLDVEKVLNTKKLSLKLPEKMPEWMQKLDGETIRIRGFMHPSVFESSDIDRFLLCRDTSACCFGPNPTIYYLIDVQLKKGTATNFIENKAFDVEGKFRIKPEKLEGTEIIYQFYWLEDAVIIKK